MELRGLRVTVRPMKRQDLDAMAQWRPFADPMYQPFDFPQQSRAEHFRWFDERIDDPTRRLYTIEDEKGQVIGSLTLREMEGRRSARLGITLGADYVSHGYGSEALRLFLDYYFETMGFGQMVLDVAATNQRAVRAYRSLGFRTVGQRFQPANHASYRVLWREQRYRHLRPFFRIQGTLHEVLFYDMALTRDEWERQRVEYSKNRI